MTAEQPTATPDADVREYAELIWEAIDDKGIRGRLYREDCDYLAAVLVASPHHKGVLAAERQAAVAPFLALADEWEHPSRPSVSGWQRHAAALIRAAAQGTTP